MMKICLLEDFSDLAKCDYVLKTNGFEICTLNDNMESYNVIEYALLIKKKCTFIKEYTLKEENETTNNNDDI